MKTTKLKIEILIRKNDNFVYSKKRTDRRTDKLKKEVHEELSK